MIKSKKDLKDYYTYEKTKYPKLPKLWWLLSFFGFLEVAIIWKYQTRLRKWEYHLNLNHKLRTLFCRVLTLSLGNRYGLALRPNCFAKGLKIMHLGSILVNGEARVGKDCSIHINTSLVATGGTTDSPTIGDGCKIGVGATIIGGIKLGDNVVIGAGAVVTKSFDEDHITLGGVPAKIISHNAII